MAKNFISAQQVREVNDVKYRETSVPEWGDAESVLRLRSMTAQEMVKFTNLKGENQKQGIVRGLIMCAVDDVGENIFSNDDISWLMEKNIAVLRRVQDDILILNGLKDDPNTHEDDQNEDESPIVKMGKDSGKTT